MKKMATVFLIAVLAPTLMLAWLAVRSLRDQEIVVNSQRAQLHQVASDALAADLNTFMDDVRVFFDQLVDEIIEEVGPEKSSTSFDKLVEQRWGQAIFACVVSDEGEFLSPKVSSTDEKAQRFLAGNRLFLENKVAAEFYRAPSILNGQILVTENSDQESTEENRGKKGFDWLSPVRSTRSDSRGRKPSSPAEGEKEIAVAEKLAVANMPEPQSKDGDSGGVDLFSPREVATETLALPKKAERKSATAATPPPAVTAPAQTPVFKRKVAVLEEKLRSVPFRNRVIADQMRQNQSLATQQTELAKMNATEQGQSESEPLAGKGRTKPDLPPSPIVSGKPGDFMELAEAADDSSAVSQSASQSQLRDRNVRTSFSQIGQDAYVNEVDEAFPLGNSVQSQWNDVGGNDNWSSLEVNSGKLRDLVVNEPEGAISRFLQDGLHVLLWNRHPAAPGRVFWAELNLTEIRKDLIKIVAEAAESAGPKAEVCMALLDSEGDVVAQTVPDFTTDWRRAFVASEVGEILPHWEVAAYLLDPGIVNRTAQTARLTMWLIVPGLLSAIGVGMFLIFRSVDSEVRLARQKTDFVSNVSHELKTPLTSIRMFSDLLAGGGNAGEKKTVEYSGIISKEAARLTRLINNLLDFSRLDRGEMPLKKEPVDMSALTRETLDHYRMQLESEGGQIVYQERIDGALTVRGDRDSLARVLLNLLSNAEKYGGDCDEIEVVLCRGDNGDEMQWQVKDHGPGIDRRHARKVFEKFYRVDDSLASGIQGTGLGLTMAQQIAEDHRGTIYHRNRSGGGSVFTVTLPIWDESEGA